VVSERQESPGAALCAVILHPRDAKEVTIPEKAKKK
jgi:hypothetical protein